MAGTPASEWGCQTLSTLRRVPDSTFLSTEGSPSTAPRMLQALYARGFAPLLAGVGPKKIATASPSGQKATSPTFISDLASSSSSVWTGTEKYTSSPHVFAVDSTGRDRSRLLTDRVPSDRKATFTCTPLSNDTRTLLILIPTASEGPLGYLGLQILKLEPHYFA